MAHRSYAASSAMFLFLLLTLRISAQIPNQLAQDFVAGEVPDAAEVAKYEKAAAASPNDLAAVRKLGKAYFFQFFGDGDADAVPRAQKTLERALTIQKDDPETLAYLGALHVIRGQRLEKDNKVKQKESFDKGFEMVRLAEKLNPRHGAVLSVASATYLYLPDSYGMAPHVIEIVEGLRKAMGPMFKQFSHHGQQRLLLTLGQAYARTGKSDTARGLFNEALAVDTASTEAGLIKTELAKLKN